MSAVGQGLITAEEFLLLPGSEHQELIRGEVVATLLTGARHGVTVATVGCLLQEWSGSSIGGYMGVLTGFILARDPDTVRGIDVSYISAERIPDNDSDDADGFWAISPDLAVEVVWSGDGAEEIRDKVRDFLAAGTTLLWVVYPHRCEVDVYTADGMVRSYGGDDVLEYPEVLPGFSCRVSEIFS